MPEDEPELPICGFAATVINSSSLSEHRSIRTFAKNTADAAAKIKLMLDQPSKVIVRASTELDVPAMIAIYAYHVQHGLGDVATEPMHPDDIKRRRKSMLKRRLPHLVAEIDGTVIGYAYAVPFRKRPAYRYAVKHSIYVHQDHLHAGVGRQLLPALIAACAESGYRQMISYIDAANLPSLHLHESFGFVRVGLLPSVGFKFGQWTDTVLMQRDLGAGNTAPPAPLPEA